MFSSITFELHRASMDASGFSLTNDTLHFSFFRDDTPEAIFFYISASPELFRQIGQKCLEFADKLEEAKQEQTEEHGCEVVKITSKEVPAA